MANWQEPRPLFPWSAPPEQQGIRTAPKLRPNIYARMARFAVQNPAGIVLAVLFLLATALTVATLNLEIDLGRADSGSRQAGGQPAIAREQFPASGRTLWLQLSADAPGSARQAAISLSESLKTQTATVEDVIVPGPESVDARFRPYYLSVAELKQKVDGVLSLTPYYQLLAASPNLAGLNNVLTTMKAAADAEQTTPALAPLLDTLSQSVEQLADGQASNIAWPEATGLATIPTGTQQMLFVVAREGERNAAVEATRALLAKLQVEKPFLNVESNLPTEVDSEAAPSSMRQVLVALLLATLFLVSSLAVGLRSARDVFFAIVPPAIAGVTALALAPALIGPVDTVAAMLPILIIPSTLPLSVPYVLALERHEKKAISPQSLIMLAAQQSGTYISTCGAIICVTWIVWWLVGAGVGTGLALVMSFAVLVAALATFLVLPMLAAVIPRERIAIVPAAKRAGGLATQLRPVLDRLAPFVTIAYLGLAGLSVLALAASFAKPGAEQLRAAPTSIYMAGEAAARQAVATLQAQPAVSQNIVWIDSFLPGDGSAKQAELQRLSALNLPVAPVNGTPTPQLTAQFKKIDDGLTTIGNDERMPPQLRDSAKRLRRTIALVLGSGGTLATAGPRVESALFSGLPRFGAFVAASANVAPLTPDDLQPALKQQFISEAGTYRLYVAPASPEVSAEAFAAALAAAQPIAINDQPKITQNSTSALLAMLAVIVATLFSLGLAFSLLRKASAAAALALSQIATAAVFGGLAWLLGLGFTPVLALAIVAGLLCNAVTSLWVLTSPDQQWSSPTGYRHGLLSSAAVTLPLLLLNLPEFHHFAKAMLAFLAIVVVAAVTVLPTLENWAIRITTPRPPKSPAPPRKEPAPLPPIVEKQVSTTPEPDDKNPS